MVCGFNQGRGNISTKGVFFLSFRVPPFAYRHVSPVGPRSKSFREPSTPSSPPVEDASHPATSHAFLQREHLVRFLHTLLLTIVPTPPPVPDKKPRPASGKLEGAGKNAKSQPNPKKRKRSNIKVPTVKPKVMPPNPPHTYAQLRHRAIKTHRGSATFIHLANTALAGR